MQIEKSDSLDINKIREELLSLTNRITGIEASLEYLKGQIIQSGEKESVQTETDFEQNSSTNSEESIEFRVGEYGMAWLGNIVLLFGIIFLVQYLQNSGSLIFSALTGFFSVAGIYTLSYFTQVSYSYLSKLFAYNGHLLLFFTTLRLHFFQAEPLIRNVAVGLFVLIVVLALLFYLSYRRKSELMAGIVLLMMLITGIISNSTQFTSGMAAFVALLAVVLYYRFGWINLVFIFISLIYLTHSDWLLNNPFIGGKLEFIKSPDSGYLYFYSTGLIFSLLAIMPKKENVSNDFIITSVVWNGLGFSFVMALIVLNYLTSNYVIVFSIISVICLIYAIVLQSHTFLKITASMYALYGFLSMSVAFYGILFLPRAFTLLSVQSLLVVVVALWFHSRFIVIMNTILFMMLLIFYLRDPVSLNTTNFSFMFAALITARVLNWKKERLNIKTDLIRNLYLVFGLVMTLIAFYHAVPLSYITVTWISVAILFFILSKLLNNIKYRWMAIATLVTCAIKLIFIDLSDIDIGFRVLMFLFLAIISIAVSILYTKYLIKKKE